MENRKVKNIKLHLHYASNGKVQVKLGKKVLYECDTEDKAKSYARGYLKVGV